MPSSLAQRAGLAIVVTGAFFVTAISTGVVGWVLILVGAIVYRVGGGRFQRTPLDWPVVILVLLAIVSVFVTADPELTIGQASRLLAGIVALYAIVMGSQTKNQLLLAAAGIVLLGLGLAIVAPFMVDWTVPQSKFLPIRFFDRFPTLVNDTIHPNVLASALLIAFSLACAWSLSVRQSSEHRWLKTGLIMATAWMLIVFVLLQSRGGYVAMAASLVVITGFLLDRRWVLMLLALMCVSALAILVLDAGAPSNAVDNSLDVGTLAFRSYVWRTAFQMISDFAFTGVGMGSFNATAMRLYPFAEVNNPGTHNLYLQVAVDLGVLGFVAFVAILLSVLAMGRVVIGRINLLYTPALHGIAVGAYAALIGLLVHGVVESTVWGTRASIMIWLLIGIITAIFTNHAYRQRT